MYDEYKTKVNPRKVMTFKLYGTNCLAQLSPTCGFHSQTLKLDFIESIYTKPSNKTELFKFIIHSCEFIIFMYYISFSAWFFFVLKIRYHTPAYSNLYKWQDLGGHLIATKILEQNNQRNQFGYFIRSVL